MMIEIVNGTSYDEMDISIIYLFLPKYYQSSH